MVEVKYIIKLIRPVVCGGLPASSLVSLPMPQILVVICGDVWWFWVIPVVSGGLWWFVVVCGDLR